MKTSSDIFIGGLGIDLLSCGNWPVSIFPWTGAKDWKDPKQVSKEGEKKGESDLPASATSMGKDILKGKLYDALRKFIRGISFHM